MRVKWLEYLSSSCGSASVGESHDALEKRGAGQSVLLSCGCVPAYLLLGLNSSYFHLAEHG